MFLRGRIIIILIVIIIIIINKYLDLSRELKRLWNTKVRIVPIVTSALGTITKGLLKGLENLEVGGRVENIQMTALLRTARILRRVLDSWEDLLSIVPGNWKNVKRCINTSTLLGNLKKNCGTWKCNYINCIWLVLLVQSPKDWFHRLEESEITGWVEAVRTIALLRTARILRRVPETRGDVLSLKIHWKSIS